MPLLRYLCLLLFCLAPAAQATPLKVATLHPLLSDLATQIGGDQVEITDLIGPQGDPHHFEPSPEALAKAAGCRIYLAAGLGLESYLPSLKSILPPQAQLIEVGATLPVLHGGGCDDPDHDHSDHELDPHWWHSIDRYRRVVTRVAEAFAQADPEHATDYRTRAASYREKLDQLERWARTQLATIPKENRHLVTAHAAFNYFCHDFGFEAIPVQGLNREQSPDPAALAAMIQELKQHRVVALFPEKESNPKLLQVLTRDTGIRLGSPLIADGVNAGGYEAMFRHNIHTLVSGLTSHSAP